MKRPDFDQAATDLAMDSLKLTSPPQSTAQASKARHRKPPRTSEQVEADNEAKEKAKDANRDLALWAEALPTTADEIRFHRNLGLRFLTGITRKQIQAMTIRDRVEASRKCFETGQILADKPTGNIRFQDRRDMDRLLPEIEYELARRKREAATINITPGRNDT